MSLENKVVSLLSLDVLNLATETMLKAFHTDPLWQYVFPNEQARQRALAGFFKAVLTLSISKQRTYGIGTPPVGIVVWNYPAQPQSTIPIIAFAPILRLAFSPFIVSAFKVRNIFAQFERMHKKYAPEPHYYLQTIGIHPEFLGQGLASRLIRPFLNKADDQGMSSYTETMTPSNMGLYEHFGFKCVEQVAVPKTQLKIWAFYRAGP